MSSYIQKKEEQLKLILPENYEYHIHGVSVKESGNVPSEVKLEAHFRVNVLDEESFQVFLSDFSERSGTSYNKTHQPDRSGKRASLFGMRKCIHNVMNKKKSGVEQVINKNGNKTGKVREPGKDTKCAAELTFSIAAPCEPGCSHTNSQTHDLKKNYPLEIKLYYDHNHAIAAADALRYRPVSEVTKKLFIDLFDEDVSPSSAYRRVLDKFNGIDDAIADRFHIPDYKWVFNFHAKYIKNRFGSADGIDVFNRIEENIKKYNDERGGIYAKAKQTDDGETIIAICDKFNKRVHENIPAAGDLLIADATANLDRNDSKIFHLMCPSPVGGLPLGTLVTTRADEDTITEALDLYKSLLPENAFYGRGKDLGPKLIITDDDSAERNALQHSWQNGILLLCIFHHLQALWAWLWKGEHQIEKDDRPILFNLFKRIVYAETTEDYNKCLDIMQRNEVFIKYENFKAHVETNILPRNAEWAIKERYEKKLPTHNQNTTNYVEYSFRMTKDVQFNRMKAYNLTDLVDICLDDSTLYSRRCLDVSHNRNYHLFTNQKSRYIFNNINIDQGQIIQLSETQFLVPSENTEDKLYNVDMETGLCECFQGFLKGPCKHKAAVEKKYKVKIFDVLPHENEIMRAMYYFLGTGTHRDIAWFRPLSEEHPFPEADWDEDVHRLDIHENCVHLPSGDDMEIDDTNRTEESMDNQDWVEEIEEDDKSVIKSSVLIGRVEKRYEGDRHTFKKAINTFVKSAIKVASANDASLQKALFSFAKDFVQTIRKGKRKSMKIPVQSTAKSRRTIKHRGRGPSIAGRPTKNQRLRMQLQVLEDEDFVRHSIPSAKSKKKKKKPHSLAEAVAANRTGERKH